MTFLKLRSLIALFGLATTIAIVPNTASAKGSVHIDVPGFSIGYRDNHGDRYYKKKRHYKRHHNRHHSNRYYDRSSRYGTRSNRYYNNRYYNNRYYDNRGYDRRGYRDRYYDRRYNDRRYYDRSSEYCPIAGFSLSIYEDRSCYRHKNHYHCE